MKRNLLLACMLTSIAFIGNAQISKGSVMLGGNLNFYSSKTEEPQYKSKQKVFGFAPVIGVAIKTNSIAGIELGYSHVDYNNYNNNGYAKQDNSSYNSELFFRQYFSLGKRFYAFGQTGIYFAYTKGENTVPTYMQESKGRSIGVNVEPGISYAVSNAFYLEVGLNNLANIEFTKSETKTIYNPSTTVVSKGESFNFSSSLNSGNSFIIGFRVFL